MDTIKLGKLVIIAAVLAVALVAGLVIAIVIL